MNQLPFPFLEIGRWWGSDPKEKRQVEIDIVAVSPPEKKAMFCECKFRKEPLHRSVIDGLIKNSSLFSEYTGKFYCMFSVSGVHAGNTEIYPQEVRAITLDMMYNDEYDFR